MAMPQIPGNEPEGRLLLPAEVSKRVRQRQKRETLQLEKILLADPRKRQMKQYIPVPALHCAVELEEQVGNQYLAGLLYCPASGLINLLCSFAPSRKRNTNMRRSLEAHLGLRMESLMYRRLLFGGQKHQMMGWGLMMRMPPWADAQPCYATGISFRLLLPTRVPLILRASSSCLVLLSGVCTMNTPVEESLCLPRAPATAPPQ
jgi:hypothetical protein